MSVLEEYIERYKELQSDETNGHMAGSQCTKLFKFVRNYAERVDRGITVLDYGCGKAWHVGNKRLPIAWREKSVFNSLSGLIQCWWLYDPAVKAYSIKPPVGLQFDVITCADVIEHIPEECLDDVLREIASYLKPDGVALFSTCTALAKHSFPDGENLHCTIKSFKGWYNFLGKYFDDYLVLITVKKDNEEKQNRIMKSKEYI